MQHYDVIISGASFAGLACAKELALRGCSVLVLERRADVKKGIRTTGILVDEARELVSLPKQLVKPIQQVRLYGPSMKHIDVRSDRYLFYATDTPGMMQHLFDEAMQAGVSTALDTAFVHANYVSDRIEVNDKMASCRFLVGADGAKSSVARVFKLGQNQNFLLGVEAEYTGLAIDNPEAFHCFLDQRLAPDYIGWAIPGPKVMQIGLATHRNEQPDIANFFHHIAPIFKKQKPEIVERRGGLIPIGGVVKPFYRDQVILLGDAAGIVSPLTAGGIHTALFYGRRLGELLAQYLYKNGENPGKVLEREYPHFRTKQLLRRLFNHTPNLCFDLLVASPFSEPIANAVFFLKKRLPK